MKIRKFIEISDYGQTKFNNSEWILKLVRFLIRITLRIFGFQAGKLILRILTKFTNIFHKNSKIGFINYLFRINYYNILGLYFLYKGDFESSINTKLLLSKLIIKESFDTNQIDNAKKYLSIMSNFESYENDLSLTHNFQRNFDKTFYIYGPNSIDPPKDKYKNDTIIVFKPDFTNIEKFKNKILFINGSYYINVVMKNDKIKNLILENFDICYVNSNKIDLAPGFVLSEDSVSGHLCSLMGLGRIIFHLKKKYTHFNCIIEGIDFYLSENPYQLKYSVKNSNSIYQLGSVDEYENLICTGLAHHDFIYNFIYTKYLFKNINIIESNDFKEILALDSRNYIKKLLDVRDFKQLNKLFLFR